MSQLRLHVAQAACAAVLACGLALAQGREVPYERFAKSFVERHELENVDPFNFRIDEFLRERFLVVPLGVFDIYYEPRSLQGKASCKQLPGILRQLLAVQREWNRAVAGSDEVAAEADLALLDKWIKSWRPRDIAAAAEAGGGNLLERMEPKREHQIAATRLRGVMLNAQALRGTGSDTKPFGPAALVFAPKRAEFLEWCAFLGTLDDDNRNLFWVPNIAKRAETRVDYPFPMHLMALEYAHPNQSGDDFVMPLGMNAREKTGLNQHVVQNGAAVLARNYLGSQVDPAIETGLIQNLTVAVCGENNTRSGGDGKGKTAAAISVFVPGGNSMGGMLAGANLDSRWRERKGKDYFIRALRAEQRFGAKVAKAKENKHAYFQLLNESESEKLAISPPFLGAAAQAREPLPEAFVDDFREFHRAYRSGFVHWLQTQAAGDDSPAKFAEFLRALAAGRSVDEAHQAVYGLPLSGEPASQNGESAFLRWLIKK